MALEQISQAVLESARNEADHIVRVAQRAAEEKIEAARRAMEQDAERRFQAAMRAFEEDAARRQIQAEGQSGKRLLEKKNERIEDVFALARQAILELPAEACRPVMRRMLEQAAVSHGGTVRVHADDRGLFEALIAEMNVSRPFEQAFRLDATNSLPQRGGFVFACPEYQVDRTLNTILSELRHEMAPAIAAGLFAALE